MKIAIKFEKTLFDTSYMRHYFNLIIRLGYEIYVLVKSVEEQEFVKKFNIQCSILNISNFKYDDFLGPKDIIIGDVDFINSLKEKSYIIILNNKINWWHIYDYIWNEVR